MMEATSYHNCC